MRITTIMIGIAAVVLLAVPSESAGQEGSLKRNIEVEQAMKEGRPPAGYNYYATGRQNVPDAILGLDPAYRQTARFWREVDPESEDLNRLVGSLVPVQEFEPRAWDVVTPDGDVIGVYWSRHFWTRVVMGRFNFKVHQINV